jgi:hypothetical protein
MTEQDFPQLLKVAKRDVSTVGCFSDIVCFVVVCADREERDIVVDIATGRSGIEFWKGQELYFSFQKFWKRLCKTDYSDTKTIMTH